MTTLGALEQVQAAFRADPRFVPTQAMYEALERQYCLEYQRRQTAQEVYVLAMRDRDSWKYTAAGMAVIATLAIAVLALVLVY